MTHPEDQHRSAGAITIAHDSAREPAQAAGSLENASKATSKSMEAAGVLGPLGPMTTPDAIAGEVSDLAIEEAEKVQKAKEAALKEGRNEANFEDAFKDLLEAYVIATKRDATEKRGDELYREIIAARGELYREIIAARGKKLAIIPQGDAERDCHEGARGPGAAIQAGDPLSSSPALYLLNGQRIIVHDWNNALSLFNALRACAGALTIYWTLTTSTPHGLVTIQEGQEVCPLAWSLLKEASFVSGVFAVATKAIVIVWESYFSSQTYVCLASADRAWRQVKRSAWARDPLIGQLSDSERAQTHHSSAERAGKSEEDLDPENWCLGTNDPTGVRAERKFVRGLARYEWRRLDGPQGRASQSTPCEVPRLTRECLVESIEQDAEQATIARIFVVTSPEGFAGRWLD